MGIRRSNFTIVALLILVVGLTACQSRPPIDVYGHKDSTSKNATIGVPF